MVEVGRVDRPTDFRNPQRDSQSFEFRKHKAKLVSKKEAKGVSNNHRAKAAARISQRIEQAARLRPVAPRDASEVPDVEKLGCDLASICNQRSGTRTLLAS